jgi:hypothetical protein
MLTTYYIEYDSTYEYLKSIFILSLHHILCSNFSLSGKFPKFYIYFH